MPRIRAGFDKLIDSVERWPSPAMLYKAMPRRPPRKELPVPDINVSGMEKGRKFFNQISKTIGGW